MDLIINEFENDDDFDAHAPITILLLLYMIQEAKKMLDETDMTITEIAFSVGFNSNTHFARVFKSIMNLSPIKYRNKSKN